MLVDWLLPIWYDSSYGWENLSNDFLAYHHHHLNTCDEWRWCARISLLNCDLAGIWRWSRSDLHQHAHTNTQKQITHLYRYYYHQSPICFGGLVCPLKTRNDDMRYDHHITTHRLRIRLCFDETKHDNYLHFKIHLVFFFKYYMTNWSSLLSTESNM